MSRLQETYRSAFLPVLAVIAGFGIPLGVVGVLVGWFLAFAQHGAGYLNPIGLVFALGGAIGFSVIGTVVVVFCFPVYLGREGVRCCGFWGTYHTVHWDEIRMIRRLNFLGLRYLVVHRPGGGKVYVPLFLDNLPGFLEDARIFAGDDNPLVRALAEAFE